MTLGNIYVVVTQQPTVQLHPSPAHHLEPMLSCWPDKHVTHDKAATIAQVRNNSSSLRREGTKASHRKRYQYIYIYKYASASSQVSSPPLFLSHPPPLCLSCTCIWGALVNRALHHEKRHPQATQTLPAAFCPLPVLNGPHRFLQSLFSYHVLLCYACLIHMNSHPIWVCPSESGY